MPFKPQYKNNLLLHNDLEIDLFGSIAKQFIENSRAKK
jgi:hypothetical protein